MNGMLFIWFFISLFVSFIIVYVLHQMYQYCIEIYTVPIEKKLRAYVLEEQTKKNEKQKRKELDDNTTDLSEIDDHGSDGYTKRKDTSLLSVIEEDPFIKNMSHTYRHEEISKESTESMRSELYDFIQNKKSSFAQY